MTDPAELRARVREATFSAVRLGDAYDLGQVDYLLDRLELAATREEPLAPIIDAAELAQVRLREGYSIKDVDEFLSALRSASLAVEGASVDEPAPAEADRVVPGPAGAPPRSRGILRRLLGRRDGRRDGR